MVAAALYLWTIKLSESKVWVLRGAAQFLAGRDKLSQSTFHHMFSRSVTIRKRLLSSSVELLRREGFESSSNSIKCFHQDNLNNQKHTQTITNQLLKHIQVEGNFSPHTDFLSFFLSLFAIIIFLSFKDT